MQADLGKTTRELAGAIGAVLLVLLVLGACGGSPDATSGVNSSPASEASASSMPSQSASVVATRTPAPTPAWTPTTPVYREVYGGLAQLAAWRVLPDGDGVEMLLALQHAGLKQRVRLQSSPGVLGVELYDLVPLPSALKPVAVAQGPISRAMVHFPPDDALVILRLRMRDPQAVPRATLTKTNLSPTALRLVVRLEE